mmetsp:Transcript_23343/g.59838  ORF Transcript_23343/g.59838 Transcript_23343/m.59838 type:complete len:280 (-) Transcript_23343:374-1213(-)
MHIVHVWSTAQQVATPPAANHPKLVVVNRHGRTKARARQLPVRGRQRPRPGGDIKDSELVAAAAVGDAAEDVELGAVRRGARGVVSTCAWRRPLTHRLEELHAPAARWLQLVILRPGAQHRHVVQVVAVAAADHAAKRHQQVAAGSEAVPVAHVGHVAAPPCIDGPPHHLTAALKLCAVQAVHVVANGAAPAAKEDCSTTVRCKGVALAGTRAALATPCWQRLPLHGMETAQHMLPPILLSPGLPHDRGSRGCMSCWFKVACYQATPQLILCHQGLTRP